MNNYEYCVQFVHDSIQGRSASVLDYGCSAGQIVTGLREKHVEAFGCDVFYEGGDYSQHVPAEMLGVIIRRIEEGRIPFSSGTFDLVINNQVMEHVKNMNCVLSEIHRVLKRGGKVLSLFPDKSVLREGHCGIPFLHWFPKQTQARVYFALLFRAFGCGYHTKGKGFFQWSKDFCDWLDKWTWYRSYSESSREYARYFVDVEHIEDHWLDRRLGASHFVSRWMPDAMKRILVRKLAGLVFVCSKKA